MLRYVGYKLVVKLGDTTGLGRRNAELASGACAQPYITTRSISFDISSSVWCWYYHYLPSGEKICSASFLLRSATQAPSARCLSCCPPLLAPTEDFEKTAAQSKSREWKREWYRKRYPENQAFRDHKAAQAIQYELKKASADPDWKQARKEYKAAWQKQRYRDKQ